MILIAPYFICNILALGFPNWNWSLVILLFPLFFLGLLLCPSSCFPNSLIPFSSLLLLAMVLTGLQTGPTDNLTWWSCSSAMLHNSLKACTRPMLLVTPFTVLLRKFKQGCSFCLLCSLVNFHNKISVSYIMFVRPERVSKLKLGAIRYPPYNFCTSYLFFVVLQSCSYFWWITFFWHKGELFMWHAGIILSVVDQKNKEKHFFSSADSILSLFNVVCNL